MFKGLSNVMAFGELTDVVKSALAEYGNFTCGLSVTDVTINRR